MPDYTILNYTIYLVLSIGLTVWVAQTLHKHGRALLVTAFHGDDKLADSINHLLVVGFYLINLGWVSLALRTDRVPQTIASVFEMVSYKIGVVLLILGAMHFINIFIFNRMRRNAMYESAPPPVTPDGMHSFE